MDTLVLQDKVIEELRTCFDPEIPVNIYELGLIYGITVDPSGEVGIQMTLTSPHCPVAGSLPVEVENKVRAIPGVAGAKVEITWDPPWEPSRMSDAARLELGMM
ncbi:MAG: SUF system Fe-S cluster assembly protein [candidate division NC10 bacterium]|nr:SUF system Fe-S cluster assembly protein [candidate division NC10 bacterium]